MFNPANQTHFSLSLDGLRHDLQVLAFNGHEGISRPYRFELELVGERAGLDLETFLHRPAFLAFTPQGQGVHGLVYGAAQGDAGKRLTRYRLTLVPHLAYLAQRNNQRIFQHLTVPQIVALILEEHGILADAYRFQLGTRYPEREYCVQYDESDLHFVQRLCAEEGIHFHFRHSAEAHLLVFGDDQTVFPRLGRPTAYVHDSGLVADEPVIKRFSLRLASRTTRTTRRDYDFEKPRLLLEAGNRPAADAPAEPDLEDYDYPGRFVDRQRGKLLSQRALERHRADRRLGEGVSDQPLLVSGHFLEIAEHPRAEWNDLWLLSEIFHEGKQPQVLEENVTSDTSAPGRRQEQLLAARSQRLGRKRLWRHRHSAGRHGSAGGLPRRRSRPAAGQRLRLPRRPPGALRVAGEPDPQRLQEPQQPWRWWLQRAAHRGSQGPGTDLRPPARLGREHRARPEDPRRPRTPRHRGGEQLQRVQGRGASHRARRAQGRAEGR